MAIARWPLFALAAQLRAAVFSSSAAVMLMFGGSAWCILSPFLVSLLAAPAPPVSAAAGDPPPPLSTQTAADWPVAPPVADELTASGPAAETRPAAAVKDPEICVEADLCEATADSHAGSTATPASKPAVRYAEKDRHSTCGFADRVAQCAIDAFRTHAARCGLEYKQTVMAAVVAVYEPDGCEPSRFTAVSIGVGTKFMRAALVAADGVGACVRDCHAEVLARRGFHRYLTTQLLCCLRGEPSICRLPAAGGERFRLLDGLTFHLYSSSQPCGNASIKRWGKAHGGERFPDLADYQLPAGKHNRLSIPKHARLEGMLALAVKREPHAAFSPSTHTASTTEFSTREGSALVGSEALSIGISGAPSPAPASPLATISTPAPFSPSASAVSSAAHPPLNTAGSSASGSLSSRSGSRADLASVVEEAAEATAAAALSASRNPVCVASGTAPVSSGEGCVQPQPSSLNPQL